MTGGVYSVLGVDKALKENWAVLCVRQDCVSSVGGWVSTSVKVCVESSRAHYLSVKKGMV